MRAKLCITPPPDASVVVATEAATASSLGPHLGLLARAIHPHWYRQRRSIASSCVYQLARSDGASSSILISVDDGYSRRISCSTNDRRQIFLETMGKGVGWKLEVDVRTNTTNCNRNNVIGVYNSYFSSNYS